MRSSLADPIALVRSDLPGALIPLTSALRIAQRAASLVATERTGFECRLEANQDQVDLQQGITRAEALTPTLPAVIESLRPAADNREAHRSWESLERFARTWSTPDSLLHQHVAQIWLEYDVLDRGPDVPRDLPSFFAVFAPATANEDGHSIPELVLAAVQGSTAVPAALPRCRAALPPGARISHLGLMLGRDVAAVRAHVSRLPVEQYSQFLEAIEWPGLAGVPQALAAELAAHCDHIILCVEVGAAAGSKLGLECFFKDGDAIDPRWPSCLDFLVARGLCTAEKRAALLEWPGVRRPSLEDAAWPDVWLVDSLIQPHTRFGIVSRRLSHLKVSIDSASPPRAKAYFGFTHSWTTRR